MIGLGTSSPKDIFRFGYRLRCCGIFNHVGQRHFTDFAAENSSGGSPKLASRNTRRAKCRANQVSFRQPSFAQGMLPFVIVSRLKKVRQFLEIGDRQIWGDFTKPSHKTMRLFHPG